MLTATDVSHDGPLVRARFERSGFVSYRDLGGLTGGCARRTDPAHGRLLPRRAPTSRSSSGRPAGTTRLPTSASACAAAGLRRRPRGDGDDRRGERPRRTRRDPGGGVAATTRPDRARASPTTRTAWPPCRLTVFGDGPTRRRPDRRDSSSPTGWPRPGWPRSTVTWSVPVGSRSCPAPSSPASGVAARSSSGAATASTAPWSRPGPTPRSTAACATSSPTAPRCRARSWNGPVWRESPPRHPLCGNAVHASA